MSSWNALLTPEWQFAAPITEYLGLYAWCGNIPKGHAFKRNFADWNEGRNCIQDQVHCNIDHFQENVKTKPGM